MYVILYIQEPLIKVPLRPYTWNKINFTAFEVVEPVKANTIHLIKVSDFELGIVAFVLDLSSEWIVMST